MMNKIVALFKKKENILSIITIIIGIIICCFRFFSSLVDDGVLMSGILLMLSLFALNAIIDRGIKDENNDKLICRVTKEIEKISKPQFYSLKEIPALKDYMAGSDELFYVGGHLNAITLNNTNLLKIGCHLVNL